MNEHLEVVIIGGGQAGLSISFYLSRLNIKHLVIEQGQVGQTWRTKRWDSFTMVTPNSVILLPGYHYTGDNPDGFMSRDEFVIYLEQYAASFNAPLYCGIRVTALRNKPQGGFLLQLQNRVLEAETVVVATGGYQVPQKPFFSRNLPKNIFQLNPEEYRNPGQLPRGAILVVGSGQSGAQIAEELHQSGRQVYLAVGSAGRWPRRYRGKDINQWQIEMGHKTIDELPPPKPRFDSNPHLSGKNGGHEINLRHLGCEGVVLLGHLRGVDGIKLSIADDLEENLLKADERVVNFKKAVDEMVQQRGLDIPQEPTTDDVAPGKGLPSQPLLELDLRSADISTVIWATGHSLDFSWIKIPIFDEYGFPLHSRGVSIQSGLYFLGLPWLYRATSSGVIGVGEDAQYIAEHIATIKQ